ncbi:hypothetical protein tb265_39160 [Gemmatimonadetes bacterium T265]|nr:hypothetical protein tb265_39160 [Gemmatimonadetes bacterium T265]
MANPLLVSEDVAAEAFVRGFRLLDPVREATNHNDGRVILAIQRIDGTTTGAAYCDSSVNYVGVGMFGRDWPMPLTASCTVSYLFAKKRGWLVTTPKRGDVFFRMTGPDEAHHTGGVLDTPDDDPSIPAGYVRVDSGNSGPATDQGFHVELMPVEGHTFARWTRGLRLAAAPSAPSAA